MSSHDHEGELYKRTRKYGSGEWLDPSVVDVVVSGFQEDLDEARKDIFSTFEISHGDRKEQMPKMLGDVVLIDTSNAEFKLVELTRRLLKWFGDKQ
jgi:hypothetical protein